MRDIRKRLEALREELRAVDATGAEAAGVVELDQTRVGRLSRMDALQAQAMSQATQARRAARLKAIDAALARVAAGQFGDCLVCGEPISAARLEFDPAAVACVACAEKQEQNR